MRLDWSELALADLAGIDAYLAEIDSDVAATAVEAIRARASQLKDHPRIGEPLDRENVRKLSIPRYRYVLIYELGADVVTISRIWHTARSWR